MPRPFPPMCLSHGAHPPSPTPSPSPCAHAHPPTHPPPTPPHSTPPIEKSVGGGRVAGAGGLGLFPIAFPRPPAPAGAWGGAGGERRWVPTPAHPCIHHPLQPTPPTPPHRFIDVRRSLAWARLVHFVAKRRLAAQAVISTLRCPAGSLSGAATITAKVAVSGGSIAPSLTRGQTWVRNTTTTRPKGGSLR